MPAYKPAPNCKTMTSRKLRKSERSKVFAHNKALNAALRRERRLARKALRDQEEIEE